MNLNKLDYRITLACLNLRRRVQAWYKHSKIVTEPKAILLGATVLLGDLMMQGPLLQALRKRYPNARITLLVPQGWGEFAKCMIGVDDALEAKLNNGRWLRQFRREHKGQWDLGVVPFAYSLIPLFYGLGINNILSFPDPKGRRAYQIQQCVKPPSQVAHMSRMLLALLQEQDSYYPAPHLRIPNMPVPEALQGKRYAVIHPGASMPTRHWPSERYVAVAKQLLANAYHIVLTGGPAEKHLIQPIVQALPSDSITNLAGKTNLLQLANVLQYAAVVIGPDTGVLHLAKALAVPNISLLGPSQREIFGLDPHFHDTAHARVLYVSDLSCRDSQTVFKQIVPGVAMCRRKQCLFKGIPCLMDLNVNSVLAALTEIGIL